MHPSANKKIAEHGAGGGIVCHLVDAELLRPRAVLEEEVVQKIQDQVAGGEDIVAGPAYPARIHWQRRLRRGDVMAAEDPARKALPGRVSRAAGIVEVGPRAIQTGVDGGGNDLDVTPFLGRDVRDEGVERPDLFAPPHGKGLVGVIHEGGHLTETSSEELLNVFRRDRVDLG